MSNLFDESADKLPIVTFTFPESPTISESQPRTLSLPEFSETERTQMEEWLKNIDDSLMSSIKPSYTPNRTASPKVDLENVNDSVMSSIKPSYIPNITMPTEVDLDNIHIRWNPEEFAANQTAVKQAYAWSKLQKKYPKAHLIELANMNSVIMERVMMYGFDD